MTDIKTKEVIRGAIKTLDRTAAAAHCIKEADVRIKSIEPHRESRDESPERQAEEHLEQSAAVGAALTAKTTAEAMKMKKNNESIESKAQVQEKERVDQAYKEYGRKTIAEKSNKLKMADKELQISNAEHKVEGTIVGSDAIKALVYAKETSAAEKVQRAKRSVPNIYEETAVRKRRDLAITRIKNARNNRQSLIALIRKGTNGRHGAEITSTFIRYVWEQARSSLLALGAGSVSAVIIVTMLVFFGIGAMTFSSNSLDDEVPADEEEIVYFIPDLSGSGSRYAIIKVAAREVGNVGGEKFWRWYGFNSHVHWCAAFTSYVAAECGFIQSGICPRSALVDDWVTFYKKQHRWAGRQYTPHSGDFIIFDWEGDGGCDHIGIVESSDGKVIHTIEGNSSDKCKRNTYIRGSSVIMGYGCPLYKD